MQTTHTPGPWQQGDGYNAHTTTVHIQSTLIAKTETEADARLIAAAPALLENLRQLCELLESIGHDCTPAREAIAKATGVK